MIKDWYDKKNITIAVGADHGGYKKKRMLLDRLNREHWKTIDTGAFELDSDDDYPEFAFRVAQAIARGKADCGILICRSGIGMSITANRLAGVRAGTAENEKSARISRQHNATNILVTGGDKMSDDFFSRIVDTWLTTPYSKEPRHDKRLEQLERVAYDDIAAVRGVDSEIAKIIDRESFRQEEGIELIASENFASAAVRAAAGSCLTNKYAEGYPGRRYYSGCERVDEAENMAIERACRLFGAEAANVQAHSGSQANMAAYFALLQPGDKVLAMSLDHGGHLTHGLKVNFSGRFYDFTGYGVSPENETLDYEAIAASARKEKPKMIMAGASAYPRTIDFARLREIADEVGAWLVVDMAHIAGLVAAGIHPNPVPHSHLVTSTTHKTLRGPRGGLVLGQADLMKKVNSQIFPGIQGGPLMHVVAAKAICFYEAMSNSFKDYQQQVVANAKHLASELEKSGFRIVSGGTDNHLMLVDLRPKETTGKIASDALDRAGITVNKNLIPFDPEKPTITSGIRLGTPAVTTRNMKEAEMSRIAEWICRIVENNEDEKLARQIRAEIAQFMTNYPLPGLIAWQ